MNRRDALKTPDRLPNASPEQIGNRWMQLEDDMVASLREKFGDERTNEWLANGGLEDLRHRMFHRFTGIPCKHES